jgi:cardiolipin synthase A/B
MRRKARKSRYPLRAHPKWRHVNVMPVPPRYEPMMARVDGHDLQVVVTGADRFQALMNMIEGAKRTLRLFFYIFGHDPMALQVREALIDACNRGVTVTLLVDGFGTADRPDSVYAPLIEAGATFARFNPKWGRGYLLRNHQKIVVADEVRALLGGSNVVDHYFSDDPAGRSWHDLYVRVEGPAAHRLARYFDHLKAWMLGDRQTLRRLVLVLARHSDTGGALRWMMAGPFRRMSPLTRRVKADLDGALRLDMVQAYFAPNWGMLRRIGKVAAREGGGARILTAARSDNATTIAAARHCYRRLLGSGVEVYEYLPQMLHMKLIVADDVTYIGSANFDMRSLFINAEIMVRIEDEGLATQMRSLFDAHLLHSDAITAQEHKARSTLVARARWLISYFLVSTVDFTVTRRLGLRRP